MRALGALLLLVVLAGCGTRTIIEVTPTTYPGDDLVIRVRTTGGMTPTANRVTEPPTVSLYGDGRLVTRGAVPARYPGPALPNLRVQRLTPAQVDAFVRQGVDAGVGAITDFGQPPVADAPTTTFVVRGRTATVSALGLEPVGTLTSAQRGARTALQDLENALASVVDERSGAPYVATRVAAVAVPWTAPPPTTLPSPPPAVAWPGPDLPGPSTGTGTYGCVVVDGDRAAAVLAAAGKATAVTPWTSAGGTWSVAFRPLLPDESSCADLET